MIWLREVLGNCSPLLKTSILFFSLVQFFYSWLVNSATVVSEGGKIPRLTIFPKLFGVSSRRSQLSQTVLFRNCEAGLHLFCEGECLCLWNYWKIKPRLIFAHGTKISQQWRKSFKAARDLALMLTFQTMMLKCHFAHMVRISSY